MREELFVYGKPAQGNSFTDREKECAKLVDNFKYGINTFVISPRRWGKTSLVMKAMAEAAGKDLLTVFVDVFKCRCPQDFCEAVSSAVLNQAGGKLDEIAGYARSILSRVTLGLNLGQDPAYPLSLNMNVRPDTPDFEEVLNLPQKIAENKHARILVCIDEFQQIGEYDDSLSFQKLLRTVWQHQNDVTYCLFGSKKHMMEGLMDSTEKPFYKFGDTLYLGRIPQEFWTPFIKGKFESEGKAVSEEICEAVCHKVDFNSYYVQQLSWLLFRASGKVADEEALSSAVEELIAQNSALFESRTEHLTAYQMNFLRAVSEGVHSGFTTSANLSRYRLGSSANAVYVRQSLIEKDLIVSENGETYLTDPVLGLWLNIR